MKQDFPKNEIRRDLDKLRYVHQCIQAVHERLMDGGVMPCGYKTTGFDSTDIVVYYYDFFDAIEVFFSWIRECKDLSDVVDTWHFQYDDDGAEFSFEFCGCPFNIVTMCNSETLEEEFDLFLKGE